MLRISNLSKSFGGLRALSDVTLSVRPGEIVGLIGPNGSGKTTTINVPGVYRRTSGSIQLNGTDIGVLRPNAIVRAGLARTFQNLRLFGTRTVLENVRISQAVLCTTLWSKLSALPSRNERALRREAEELVARFELAGQAHVPAAGLAYGQKKRLEIARALASHPKILLLDEPAAGMNPVEIDWLMREIRAIREQGIGILLIEHHMKLVMNICDRIAVLNFGQMIAEGTPQEVAAHPAVIESYLGKAE